MLLGFIEETEREKAIGLPLEQRTPHAEIGPERLREQARNIRKRGWEFAKDDFVVGLAGLGVPILSPQGRLFGVVSISTLTTIHGDAGTPTYLSLL